MVVSIIVYFHLYLEKIPIFTNIFRWLKPPTRIDPMKSPIIPGFKLTISQPSFKGGCNCTTKQTLGSGFHYLVLFTRTLQKDRISRWWFQIFFHVHPNLGKINPIWRAYFSKGLVKPPTRKISMAKKNHRLDECWGWLPTLCRSWGPRLQAAQAKATVNEEATKKVPQPLTLFGCFRK